MARELERLNINLPVDLMDRVREYSDRMAVNKTSAVAVLLSQALDNQKAISTLEELINLVKDNSKDNDN